MERERTGNLEREALLLYAITDSGAERDRPLAVRVEDALKGGATCGSASGKEADRRGPFTGRRSRFLRSAGAIMYRSSSTMMWSWRFGSMRTACMWARRIWRQKRPEDGLGRERSSAFPPERRSRR